VPFKKKKIQDQSKVCAEEQRLVELERESGKRQGLMQDPITEPIPNYEKAPSETTIKGSNNSFIVFGRDRPSHMSSGYGARGATEASRIDLIAGLASSYRHKDGTYGPPCKDTIVSPNFATDAARLYISQKCDLDRYMGLAPVPMDDSAGRSGIGMKADEIRLHARGNIKIITGRGKFENVGKEGERFSGGGINEVPGTISLIAGNTSGHEPLISLDILDITNVFKKRRRALQPLVKGDNLIECIFDLTELIMSLRASVGTNTMLIQKMDALLASHTHPLAPPVATLPISSYVGITPLVQAQAASESLDESMFFKKIMAFQSTFLSATEGTKSNPNPRFINSNFVFTT
jgi:hypothetical protein